MESTWSVLHVPGGDTALELLFDTLVELGAEGFTSDDSTLHVFFRDLVNDQALLSAIQGPLSSLIREGLLPDQPAHVEQVENEDWVGRWRRSLGPIPAGNRFVVVPPGVEAELEEDQIALRLEPRMAFGTGEHPTTRMALELLEETVRPGDHVLDMGCGNGVLSIAALLLGAESAFGIDNEQEAVDETLENAASHGVGERMTALFGDVLKDSLSGSYSLLLANIFVNPILQGLPSWLEVLTPDAECIFTGVQAGEEEHRLLQGVAELGLDVVETRHLDTWFAARCKRQHA